MRFFHFDPKSIDGLSFESINVLISLASLPGSPQFKARRWYASKKILGIRTGIHLKGVYLALQQLSDKGYVDWDAQADRVVLKRLPMGITVRGYANRIIRSSSTTTVSGPVEVIHTPRAI